MTQNKSQSESTVSYLSNSQDSAQTTLQQHQGLDNYNTERDAEGFVSEMSSSMHQETIYIGDSSISKDEVPKDKNGHKISQNGDVSTNSQSDISNISKNSSTHSNIPKHNVNDSQQQNSQKKESRELTSQLRQAFIYQKTQTGNNLKQAKANLKREMKVSRVIKQSSDEDEKEQQEITFSAENIARSLSQIARKFGSALDRPKDELPVSKRTRKQMKIEMKNQLQKQKQQKQQKQQQKNPKLSTNKRTVNRSGNKGKAETKIQTRSRSIHNIQNSSNSIQARSLFSSASKNQKKSKSRRPRSKSIGKHTPQKHSKAIANKQQTYQSIGYINSERKSVSPISQEKKSSKFMDVVKIRQLERDSRDCLEYLLDFSDGSIQVFTSEQLAKLWPRKYGVYLLAKIVPI